MNIAWSSLEVTNGGEERCHDKMHIPWICLLKYKTGQISPCHRNWHSNGRCRKKTPKFMVETGVLFTVVSAREREEMMYEIVRDCWPGETFLYVSRHWVSTLCGGLCLEMQRWRRHGPLRKLTVGFCWDLNSSWFMLPLLPRCLAPPASLPWPVPSPTMNSLPFLMLILKKGWKDKQYI